MLNGRLQVQAGAGLQADSDAWMAEGPAEIEKELQARQTETDTSSKAPKPSRPVQDDQAGEDFDPGEFARRMQVGCHADCLH